MNNSALPVIRLGLICLLGALMAGLLSAFSYLYSDGWGKYLHFERLRPLHVSFAVFWILSTAIGGVAYYMGEIKKPVKAKTAIPKYFLWIWAATLLLIQASFLTGRFGGREYWEFPPLLSIPLLVCWGLFAVFFFRNLAPHLKNKPVYLWMWITGVIFFFVTYLEGNLWHIPWFRNNVIRDITVQWKSNGSLVGSWNMLIYGTGLYLMGRISGNDSAARRPISYFFYFLGLINLLYNWGHHTYIVPAAPWIRHVSYAISMTEWIVLINIIRTWKGTLHSARKHYYHFPYRFLLASEFWILFNLVIAIFMSIPAINVYTHGTHVTVAHAMGTTIGINTMILLASVLYIWEKTYGLRRNTRLLNTGYWLANISLLVFLFALMVAGIIRGYHTVALAETSHSTILDKTWLPMALFGAAGAGVFAGLGIIAVTLLACRKNMSKISFEGERTHTPGVPVTGNLPQ